MSLMQGGSPPRPVRRATITSPSSAIDAAWPGAVTEGEISPYVDYIRSVLLPTGMMVSRRRLLFGASLLGAASVAGCLDDVGEPSTDREGNGDGSEPGDDSEPNDGDEGTTGGYSLVGYETFSYSVAAGKPRTEVLPSRSEAEEAIADAETTADLEAFVDGTDFERAVLLFVRATGPNLCYELELEGVDVDDGGVTVETRVVDTSTADELCAQQVHYPTLLVRLVFEDDVPDRDAISVTGLEDADDHA